MTDVRVTIEQDDYGVYVATSPDLKGLIVVSKDLQRLQSELVPEAIRALQEAAKK